MYSKSREKKRGSSFWTNNKQNYLYANSHQIIGFCFGTLGLQDSASADSNQAETPICSWYESWCEFPVSLLKSVTKSLIFYPVTPNSNHNKISKKVFSFLKNINKTKVLRKTGFVWMVTPKKIYPQIWK